MPPLPTKPALNPVLLPLVSPASPRALPPTRLHAEKQRLRRLSSAAVLAAGSTSSSADPSTELRALCSHGRLAQALWLLESSAEPPDEDAYVALFRLCEWRRAVEPGLRACAHTDDRHAWFGLLVVELPPRRLAIEENRGEATEDIAWETLKTSRVFFNGLPFGTVAATDKSKGPEEYEEVFMRDFVLSAFALLMKGEHLIVKNFLVETARLRSRVMVGGLCKLGSFKVHHCNPTQKTESLLAYFGETSIGTVAPVDSGLWWIILLHAYTKATRDNSVAENRHCQKTVVLILMQCLSEGYDTKPALLCADGCSMIDRRMVGFPAQLATSVLLYLLCNIKSSFNYNL